MLIILEYTNFMSLEPNGTYVSQSRKLLWGPKWEKIFNFAKVEQKEGITQKFGFYAPRDLLLGSRGLNVTDGFRLKIE